MPEVGPDHPVVEELREHWQKIAALIMWKLNVKRVEILEDDIISLAMSDPRGMPVILAHAKNDKIIIMLMSGKEADSFAKLHGDGEDLNA